MKTASIFYLASLIAAILGLAVHLLAREQNIKSSKLRGQSWGFEAGQGEQMRSRAAQYKAKGHELALVGWGSASFSLAALVVARCRRERGWYLLPIFLLICGVVVQMLL